MAALAPVLFALFFPAACGRPIGAVFDGDAGRRDAAPCTPSIESCNGRDDDCDGEIDEDGVCVCDDPLRLEVIAEEYLPGPGDAADPWLVWTGTEYGAAWNGGFARLSRGLQVIESHPSVGLFGSAAAQLVHNGSGGRYLWCWSAMANVVCGIKTPGSAQVESVTAIEREGGGIAYNNPRVAHNADADQLAIVYPTGLFGAQQYTLQIVDSDFLPVGPARVINETSGLSIWHTAILWTGEEYAFAYAAADGVYVGRFDAAGERLAPDFVVPLTASFEYLSNTLLWDGAMYHLAYSDFDNIYHLRFPPSGQTITETPITTHDGSLLVYGPVLTDGPWIGMTWYTLEGSDFDNGTLRIMFTVLSPEGQPLIEPFTVSERGLYPSVVSDGQTYVVGWRHGEDIWDPEIGFARIGCPGPN